MIAKLIEKERIIKFCLNFILKLAFIEESKVFIDLSISQKVTYKILL